MLRIPVKVKCRNLPSAGGRGSGPQGRINKMRKLVTALIRHERIEGQHQWVDEARGYAERLIMEAQRNGDTHKATMEMADYWLLEKDLIHKLFKILVPRYTNYPAAFTQIWNLGETFPGRPVPMAVLELKGNPWPPVISKERDQKNSLVNVLLEQARKEYRQQKYESMAALELNKQSEQQASDNDDSSASTS
ncbi:39S ribosomal protein L17, mitochondrial [Lamellibrachia satsuma]|nr:39S ribosomal protein L17, mitochondrial [Lamellibrachia satsuma]